jgi:hypothetical protein
MYCVASLVFATACLRHSQHAGQFAVTMASGASEVRIWEIATGRFYRRRGRNVSAR